MRTGTTMIIPRYVNEIISDVRGIKLGWYAMDEVGNLSTGPFSSHAECLGSIIQPASSAARSHPGFCPSVSEAIFAASRF